MVIWILKQVKVSVGDELGSCSMARVTKVTRLSKTSEHRKHVAMVTNSCIQPCIRKYLEHYRDPDADWMVAFGFVELKLPGLRNLRPNRPELD